MRDNFTKLTIQSLAKRAGFCCSNPDCQAPTVGADPKSNGIINIGVAAHITAASPDGPRYAPSLKPDERSDIKNGIWLCQNCSKLIDDSESTFPIEKMFEWKASAERRSFSAVSSGKRTLETIIRCCSRILERNSSSATTRLSPQLGYYLSPSPVAPGNLESRRETVGDVARWRNLIAGAYAERPELLEAVTKEYLGWILSISELTTRRSRVPVFWISGRSGDGKSVLLLQLAFSIIAVQQEPNVYQSTLPDNLPELLNIVSANSEGRLALVICDDLHKVSDTNTFQASLKTVIDSSAPNTVIVTCGPTPEMEQFIQENPLMEIYSWQMPLLSISDLPIFERWFDISIPIPNSLQQTILAELLFVSKVGENLSTFASNFRKRLQRFSLQEIVEQIVFLNSFDIAAPVSMFHTPAERDSVSRLAQSDQLHFQLIEGSFGLAARLVHRNIALKLFEEWSADPLRSIPFSTRIAREFSRILASDRLSSEFKRFLVIRVSKHISSYPERFGIATVETRQRFYDELLLSSEATSQASGYSVHFILNDLLANKHHYTSKFIAKCVTTIEDIDTPDLIRLQIAGQLAALEYTGSIPLAGHRAKAESLIFDRQLGGAAHDMVRTLVSKAGVNPIVLKSWLEAFRPKNTPHSFLGFALDNIGAHGILIEIIGERVLRDPMHRSAWESLLPLVRLCDSTDVTPIAIEWIRHNLESAFVPDVFSLMLHRRSADCDVRSLALEWVKSNHHKPRAVQLMGALLKHRRSGEFRSSVREEIYLLIKRHWDHSYVPDLLSLCLKKFRKDLIFVNLSSEWVKDHWGFVGCGNLFPAMIKGAIQDKNIISMGLEWVQLRPAGSQESCVLGAIVSCRSSDEDEIRAVMKWARTNIGSVHIFQLIANLTKNLIVSEEAVQLAVDWIKRHGKTKSAGQLISALLKAVPNNAKYQTIASSWVADHINDKLSGHVISSLLRETEGSESTQRLALVWLENHSGRAEAGQLISTLLATGKDGQYEQTADQWIEGVYHQPKEQHQVLATLIAVSRDKSRWIRKALDLLTSMEGGSSLPYLYCALVVAAPDNPEVIERLEAFLYNPLVAVNQRQSVLEEWIAADIDARFAINGVLRLFRCRNSISQSGREMFGILARACAMTSHHFCGVFEGNSRDIQDLSYLVGRGIPSVRANYQHLVSSIDLWPESDASYILRGLLDSKADLTLFIEQLCLWLRRNWRRKGYGEVMQGIRTRSERGESFPKELTDILRDVL